MSGHDIIVKRILLGQGSFFYPKSPYSFLKYLVINVSIWLDLFILYFLLTFSNSSINSGGNVIFNLFLCFLSFNTLKHLQISLCVEYTHLCAQSQIHTHFLHNAQCTPRGGRSTPPRKTPQKYVKQLPKNLTEKPKKLLKLAWHFISCYNILIAYCRIGWVIHSRYKN